MKISPIVSAVTIMLLFIILDIIPGYAWEFDAEVKERVRSMDLCIDSQYDQRVKHELGVYLRLSHSSTEKILERMVQYFPIIEPILQKYGLPLDLKYLVVVESEINPYAESCDGAVGLWQLMPETARELGLRVDDFIDERRDPIKSTEAASAHLSYLNSRLDNWKLSLAAYNGGLRRVKRAIRIYGNSFSLIQAGLPKETSEFPSSYVAAAYLCQYYDKHFFTTPKINPDIQLIDQITMYNRTEFRDISIRTGLPLKVIYQLNPMYKKGYIPLNEKGMTLTLPARLTVHWETLDKSEFTRADIIFYNPYIHYTTILLDVEKDQSVLAVAKLTKTDPYLIRYWNHLQSGIIDNEKSLVIISSKKEPANTELYSGQIRTF